MPRWVALRARGPRLHEHLDERVEEGGRVLLPHHAARGVRKAGVRPEARRAGERVVLVHVALHHQLPLRKRVKWLRECV